MTRTQRTVKSLSESKLTTAAGGITLFAGILLPLIPSEVRANCVDAVTQTENPLMMGSLVVAGIVLTSIGPSLAKRSKHPPFGL